MKDTKEIVDLVMKKAMETWSSADNPEDFIDKLFNSPEMQMIFDEKTKNMNPMQRKSFDALISASKNAMLLNLKQIFKE